MNDVIGDLRRPARWPGIDWVIITLFTVAAAIMGFAIKGLVDVVSSF